MFSEPLPSAREAASLQFVRRGRRGDDLVALLAKFSADRAPRLRRFRPVEIVDDLHHGHTGLIARGASGSLPLFAFQISNRFTNDRPARCG